MAVTKLSNSGIRTGGNLKYDTMLAGNPPFIPTDFDSIMTVSGNGSASTLVLDNIPQTYQHLQIRMVGKTGLASSGADWINVRFNNATSTYWYHHVFNNVNTVIAEGFTLSSMVLLNSAARGNESNILAPSIVDIHDYASTTKNKTLRRFGAFEKNANGSTITLTSGIWLNTDPITSISFTSQNNAPFETDNRFALYGIKG